jgi:phosphatidylserine/phosphatidylglycerophosphate/cardiolipin synthase-like enzyme
MRKILVIAVLSASVLLPASVNAVSPAIEVAFSPGGGATELVEKTIAQARQSIRVAAYSFTSKPIAQALLEAHKRAIDVRVVLDKANATARYSSATFLANVGIPTRINHRYAIMHDKFMVVDGEMVETGSFNFTASAEARNAENVLVLRDPAVAQRYAQESERLWGESEEMRARY